MAFTLAFLEAGSVFAAVCLLMVAGAEPALFGGWAVPGVVAPALAVSICCLVSFYYNDLYELPALQDLWGVAPRLMQSLGAVFLIVAVGYPLLPGGQVSLPLLVSMFVLVVGLVLPLRAMSYGLIARRAPGERVVILGSGPLAQKIAEEIHGNSRYALAGVVDDAGLEPMIREMAPDRLVVALGERRGKLPVWALLSSCATGLRVEDGVEFYERLTRKLAIESLSPSWLIFQRVLQKSRWKLALRRALSLVVAGLGLLVAAPLMAVIAALVKLDSPGPVFFIQERVGLRGRTFRLIKFRTMRGAPPAAESVWRRDDCPRLTRLGRMLRDLHLDELPQFINVLRGDMDVVGPRPEMACNVQTMTEQIPYYGLRHVVRPGVTGWAQIKQGYSVSQAEVTEKMRYDLYYIKHMSLALDLRILLGTARILLLGRRPE